MLGQMILTFSLTMLLTGFSGDPAASNEAKLEAIQMAWHEEYQDRQS